MKLAQQNKPRRNQGNILITSLVTTAVLGVALASVLALTQQEYRTTARSTAWNLALPAAEAGIEEALSHLKTVEGEHRQVNGWYPVKRYGTIHMSKQGQLGKARYEVFISPEAAPRITSTGFVRVRGSDAEVSRTVSVTTEGEGTFSVGLFSRDYMSFGGQFLVDSFDSRSSLYSTGGRYDPARRRDKVHVGSMQRHPESIKLSGQVKIYGTAHVAPGGGVVVDNVSQSQIGSIAHVDGGGTGIESGRLRRDLNLVFPDAILPSASWLPQNIKPAGINTLTSGHYRLTDKLTLNGKGQLLIDGHVMLRVPEGVDMSGQGKIVVQKGGSLQIYVERGAVNLTGNGIANQTGLAKNFGVWGLNQVQDVNISGNGEITGTLYAPSAKLNLSGGGTDPLDFMGSAIVNSVEGSGHFKFHYDEALGGDDKGGDLDVVSWTEIAAK